MKTLIELYVNEQYDNLLAAYVFKPERVVFICTEASPDKLTRKSITSFLTGIRQDIKVEFVLAINKSVGSLFNKLDTICKKYPDSAVEMSGGSTASLVAAQSYCTKYRIKAFYFDYAKSKFVSIRGMRRQIADCPMPKMDIDAILSIGGAKVTGTCHSVKMLDEGDNLNCVREMLSVYCKNLDDWNANSEYLQYCCKHYYDSATQLFSAPATIRTGNALHLANRRLLVQLQAAGAINELGFENDNVTFRFRNSFIREALTTVGMCMELLIYIGARDAGCFTDVDMSVVFDWDGITHPNTQDTVNEIDVVMTRGLSTVFVSCKSAKPDTRDLYEIQYLARRFGGRRAKAVIATAVPLSADAWATYIRARDMGIAVIERADIAEYDGKAWLRNKLLTPSYRKDKPSRNTAKRKPAEK